MNGWYLGQSLVRYSRSHAPLRARQGPHAKEEEEEEKEEEREEEEEESDCVLAREPSHNVWTIHQLWVHKAWIKFCSLGSVVHCQSIVFQQLLQFGPMWRSFKRCVQNLKVCSSAAHAWDALYRLKK